MISAVWHGARGFRGTDKPGSNLVSFSFIVGVLGFSVTLFDSSYC
jgi:hypothetical protein